LSVLEGPHFLPVLLFARTCFVSCHPVLRAATTAVARASVPAPLVCVLAPSLTTLPPPPGAA